MTLTAPGAVTVVALIDRVVVGFAFAFVDASGFDAYLETMVVDPAHRRHGIGRSLIRAVFDESGVSRVDLLAEPASEAFYESLPHRPFRGYRLYRQSN